MRILLACEESQAVCKEFRAQGHEAFSCDILPCSGGHPEWHIQGDVINILNDDWDMMIAFPPCTYISNAGAAWLWRGGKLNQERYEKGMKARDFFMRIYNSDCKRIAIENPTPSKVFELPEPNQVIEPYYFGDEYIKRTLLWLKGLPPLIHSCGTDLFCDKITHVKPKSHWVNSTSNYRHNKGLKPGLKRKPKDRSKTFPGIAAAMAEQWG